LLQQFWALPHLGWCLAAAIAAALVIFIYLCANCASYEVLLPDKHHKSATLLLHKVCCVFVVAVGFRTSSGLAVVAVLYSVQQLSGRTTCCAARLNQLKSCAWIQARSACLTVYCCSQRMHSGLADASGVFYNHSGELKCFKFDEVGGQKSMMAITLGPWPCCSDCCHSSAFCSAASID
jgi:hypothetical protein